MAELADDLEPDEDARLDQAEGLVRRYCRWHIAPSRADQTFTLTRPTRTIVLPSLHVTAVSVTDADQTPVPTADYEWTEAGVVHRRWGCWWEVGTTVTFTHGYATVPPEVTAIVQAKAQRAIDNPLGRVSHTDGPFSDTFAQAGGFLDDERAVLDSYRIPSRP